MVYLDSVHVLSDGANKFARKIISDDEFSKRFEPIGEDDGPVDAVPPDTDPACIWTCVDTDVGDSIVSGIHMVNQFAYWICRVPVPAEEHYEVVVEQAPDLA